MSRIQSQKSFPMVDNTFQSEHYIKSANRYCRAFTREEGFHRQYNEFEDSNLKRLMKKQDLDSSNGSFTPKYSVGGSKYTSRPPTGVDLALGLNGYDKIPTPLKPARLPSSLQPLEDVDDLEKCRRRMARWETTDAKWDNMRAEVEARKNREEEERRKMIDAANKQKFEKESERMREENSRQLNRAVVDDWKYQSEFKQRRKDEDRLENEAHALQEKQVIEEEKRQEIAKMKQLQNKLFLEREAELSDLNERRLIEDLESHQEKNVNVVRFGRMEMDEQMLAEKMEAEERKRKNETRIQLQKQIDSGRSREEMEKTQDLAREKQLNTQNNNFVAEYGRQMAADKNAAANHEASFQKYKETIAENESGEQRASDAYFKVESREVVNDKHDRNVQLAEERRRIALHHSDLIQDQIRERATLARKELEVKRLEEENRLLAESNYRSKLLAEKEKKAQDQRNYRDYLFGQMEERKRIQMQDRHRDKIFHEEQKTSEHKWEIDTRNKVADVNVNQQNFMEKPVVNGPPQE